MKLPEYKIKDNGWHHRVVLPGDLYFYVPASYSHDMIKIMLEEHFEGKRNIRFQNKTSEAYENKRQGWMGKRRR